jgi:hypothetical protein
MSFSFFAFKRSLLRFRRAAYFCPSPLLSRRVALIVAQARPLRRSEQMLFKVLFSPRLYCFDSYFRIENKFSVFFLKT